MLHRDMRDKCTISVSYLAYLSLSDLCEKIFENIKKNICERSTLQGADPQISETCLGDGTQVVLPSQSSACVCVCV
jgi:hypothetical protein